MKKTLLMGGAALLALALVFTGCDNAYDVTTTSTIPSLSGPGNLKVVNDHEGVITVTWDLVDDAAGYEVWRKTGDEPVLRLNGNLSNNAQRYDDIVSATNPLQNGTEYTYTVVAVSSHSTSRGVDVVQNGKSEAKVKAEKIPATYTVNDVKGLTVAQIIGTNGLKTVQVSWDRDPNPGVTYKGEFGGQGFWGNDISYSSDRKKAAYIYNINNSSLIDGEPYKAKVTAYYSTGYYTTTALVESAVYTHSDPNNFITSFYTTPVTLYSTSGATSGTATGDYNLSVYWMQDTKAPAGIVYELYVHKSPANGNSSFEWTKVTIPADITADPVGFFQTTLSGDNRPAYRQSWTYKLVAKIGGEEVDSRTYTLDQDAWQTPNSLGMNVTTSNTTGRKIKIEVTNQVSDLVGGDVVEFYAVLSRTYNSNGDTTASDQYLSQFTKLGERDKSQLENSDSNAREFDSGALATGRYTIIAVLKNGETRILLNDNISSVNVTN
ncbi:MAG: fibronectin type III domain-containing protein [Treponema sp.]|jgi:hypothetical protein|nr:fibronectin type III domain-containing protein [Treponema sp.]